jgi:hypothetical protein
MAGDAHGCLFQARKLKSTVIQPSAFLHGTVLSRRTNSEHDMDTDLDTMTREQLIDEVKKLRAGIRTHRDMSGHDLCWYHPHLWALLPEKVEHVPTVPDWPQFMRGCVKYRESLDAQCPQASRVQQEFGE